MIVTFALTFALAGIILVLGFIGDYLFKKRAIPDVLILILLGFLLGPVLKIIHPTLLAPLTPLLVSLALLTILFDAGLNLDLYKVFERSPRAVVLSIVGVIFSIAIGIFFSYYFLLFSFWESILFGVIVSGTSSAIVIPLVGRMKVPEEINTLLSLESVFTDVIVIVVGMSILEFLVAPTLEIFSLVLKQIASAFSVGALMGMVIGVIWLKILKVIRGVVYDDILTLSIALLFFAVVESLGGNGGIFALVFGLVLGNGKIISEFLKTSPIEATGIMKKFQAEISFLIRTFFFLYLGLIFSFQSHLLLNATILTLLLLIGRYIATLIVSVKDPIISKSRGIVASMIPRGLAAAVMSQMVFIQIGNKAIVDYVTSLIIVSVIAASISTIFFKPERIKANK